MKADMKYIREQAIQGIEQADKFLNDTPHSVEHTRLTSLKRYLESILWESDK